MRQRQGRHAVRNVLPSLLPGLHVRTDCCGIWKFVIFFLSELTRQQEIADLLH